MWLRKILVGRAEQSMPRWFGYVWGIKEERMVKNVFGSEIVGVRDMGRPIGS